MSINRLLRSAVFVLLLAALSFWPAQAGRRAFVVGIDDYSQGLPQLGTAVNDASGLAQSLTSLGFKVDLVRNPDRATFDQRWLAFRSSLEAGDVASFYFAGHAIQIQGLNFLLLADTRLSREPQDVLATAVNFHNIMEELEARRLEATIYILDSCRNNPFADLNAPSPMAPSLLGQSKGLARMESVLGAFVMYAAGSDEEALDSLGPKDRNSLYASRIIPLLRQRNLSLVDIAKRVQVDVEAAARGVGHRQRPAYFDGILGAYYLAGGAIGTQTQADGSVAQRNISSSKVVRLGGFATWDSACKARPAPRIGIARGPAAGRIMTRFEDVTIGGTHFGRSCEKSVMRGVGIYYLASDEGIAAGKIDTVELDVHHWSVAPATTARETFEIDLASRISKRLARASAPVGSQRK